MTTKRYLSDFIATDLDKKITLLSGPRQSGKTTLSKALPFTSIEYLNFDEVGQRRQIISKNWSSLADLLIFDELHKMTKWKSWIKGIYDTEGVRRYMKLTQTYSCKPAVHFPLHRCWLNQWKDSTDPEPSSPWA
jgi:predicted AAA+ superfamily ATPase